MNNIMLNIENKMVNVFVDIITPYKDGSNFKNLISSNMNKKIIEHLSDKYAIKSTFPIFFYDNYFKYKDVYISYSSIYKIEAKSNSIYLFRKYSIGEKFNDYELINGLYDIDIFNLVLEKLIEKIFNK